MLKKVNLMQSVDAVKGLYLYQTVGQLNGNALRVVQVQDRTLDFHVHEESDELFYVIEGAFSLETEDGLLPLQAGELVIVPKGIVHRPVVGPLAKFLMIDLDGTLNKENSGALFEEEPDVDRA